MANIPNVWTSSSTPTPTPSSPARPIRRYPIQNATRIQVKFTLSADANRAHGVLPKIL